MNFGKNIGERVKTMRGVRKLGVGELSNMIGSHHVSQQYISGLERGTMQDPGAGKMALIAEALDIDLNWLITGKNTPEQDDDIATGCEDNKFLNIIEKLSPVQQQAVFELCVDYCGMNIKEQRKKRVGLKTFDCEED